MRHYPEYKESSVEWIGKIPKDWEIKKIKYMQSSLVGGVWGNEPEGNENDIYCIRVEDFNYVQLAISTYNLTLRNIRLKERDKRILRTDDLLVEKSGGGEKSPVGRTVIFDGGIPGPSVTSNFISKFTAESNSCFPRYLLYCLSFLYQIGLTKKHIKQSTGLQNLDIDSYFQERIPFPSLVEQIQIANFLDRKMGQIDELIRVKERRIELLQEQRTALINQAVTKGLDPNVEIKPSGVDWIGKICKHWEIKKLKYIVQGGLTNGLFKKKDQFGSGVKLINVTDMYQDEFLVKFEKLDRVEAEPREIETYAVEPGDIFFVRSSLKLEGVAASACITDVPEPTVFECHLVRLHPCPTQVLFKYLINYLNSTQTRQRLITLANTVTMTTIAQPKLASIEVVLPSLSEQHAIIDYLDKKTQQIHELITAEQRKIELLKEYRQSLISETVTGKIDVRDEV